MLLFTHGIDLAKDIARNCGVSASVDWVENTVTLTSQDIDLIAKAVQRFTKLEEFYVQTLISGSWTEKNRPGLPFVYLQTLLRLNNEMQDQLVTNIEVLRIAFPGTTNNSVADRDDLIRRDSINDPAMHTTPALGEGIAPQYNRMPLTKEALDLMDTPVPSGVLAEEFAYHGLASSFLKEMTQARNLLDDIYTEVKK